MLRLILLKRIDSSLECCIIQRVNINISPSHIVEYVANGVKELKTLD